MGSLVQVEQAAVAKANAAVLASMDAAKRTRDSHNIAYSQLSESVSNKEAPKSPPGSPKVKKGGGGVARLRCRGV